MAKAVNLGQLVPQMLERNVSHGVSVGLVLPGAEVTLVSNATIVWFDLLVNLSFCVVGRKCSCVVRGEERRSCQGFWLEWRWQTVNRFCLHFKGLLYRDEVLQSLDSNEPDSN